MLTMKLLLITFVLAFVLTFGSKIDEYHKKVAHRPMSLHPVTKKMESHVMNMMGKYTSL